MPLLDNPLDSTMNGRFKSLNKLSKTTRWGWTLGWGIFPIVALVSIFNGGTERGAGFALLLTWAVAVLLCIVRPHGWTSSSGKRVWVAWVIAQFVVCGFMTIMILIPNP